MNGREKSLNVPETYLTEPNLKVLLSGPFIGDSLSNTFFNKYLNNGFWRPENRQRCQ